ncbi:hypothetical protein J2Y83_002784 [Pseudomonas marginalis]|uniref:pyocin knob domain-containing protein n=1 Tax=Pseudomonas marginalis TaxID=298 RepID=UPI00209CDEDE|nr:pyocin knob domain-containing protein [Pseudomonas marginalis]MCP1506811.1 hypothetical protein [Pseudomonas marginalis]MCP1524315.1 hypothetical protein [Pseudomonas marginalis]MDQ0499728.1 hypothetical protein [Pseudomonas marginalis]
MGWYKTGTVSVASGSNAVIGTGTSFIANSRVGDAFRGPDGGWYEVTNIASDTALSISPTYQGATVATGSYSLAPMQGYVKDSADALRAATQVIASTATDMTAQVTAAQAAAASATASKDAVTVLEASATQSKNAAASSAATAASAKDQSAQSASEALANKNSSKTSETNAANSAAVAQAAASSVTNKASAGANSDITSLSGLTTALSVAQGGTGGKTQVTAQAALGLPKAAGNSSTSGEVLQVGHAGWNGGVAILAGAGTDCNSLQRSSLYALNATYTNGPPSFSGGPIYIRVSVHGAGAYLTQEAFGITSNLRAIRCMSGGVWGGWAPEGAFSSLSGAPTDNSVLSAALSSKLSITSTGGTSANGWIKYSDGTIEQWGTVSVANAAAGVTFSFNTPFLTGVRLFLATTAMDGRGAGAEANNTAIPMNLSQFKIASGHATTPVNVTWYAKGI